MCLQQHRVRNQRPQSTRNQTFDTINNEQQKEKHAANQFFSSLLVSHERMHEISTEMCGLLDQQAKLLVSRSTLSTLSAEEVDVYAHRNDLLYELSTRLIEL